MKILEKASRTAALRKAEVSGPPPYARRWFAKLPPRQGGGPGTEGQNKHRKKEEAGRMQGKD
ncbi:hypothetical protein KI387_031424, partial [Taxus chinensis]